MTGWYDNIEAFFLRRRRMSRCTVSSDTTWQGKVLPDEVIDEAAHGAERHFAGET